MLAIAIWINVCVTPAISGCITAPAFAWGRIVLYNKIVPIGDPEVAVWSYLGNDGREPLIRTGYKAECILCGIACTFFYDIVCAE